MPAKGCTLGSVLGVAVKSLRTMRSKLAEEVILRYKSSEVNNTLIRITSRISSKATLFFSFYCRKLYDQTPLYA